WSETRQLVQITPHPPPPGRTLDDDVCLFCSVSVSSLTAGINSWLLSVDAFHQHRNITGHLDLLWTPSINRRKISSKPITVFTLNLLTEVAQLQMEKRSEFLDVVLSCLAHL
ncbi:hypothetical protein STEG23_016075, partial [Scotinomys teguina]